MSDIKGATTKTARVGLRLGHEHRELEAHAQIKYDDQRKTATLVRFILREWLKSLGKKKRVELAGEGAAEKYTHKIEVRVDEADKAALGAIAVSNGCDVSALARFAIKDWLSNNPLPKKARKAGK